MKNKLAPLIFATLTLSLAVSSLYFFLSQGKKTSQHFDRIKVELKSISSNILMTGSVAPFNRVDIKPSLAGRIESVNVNEGVPVRQGQPMAEMSSSERAALVDMARTEGPTELKKWEASYPLSPVIAPVGGIVIAKNIVPGQTVTTNDILFSLSDMLIIRAVVDETDIAHLYLKQPVLFSLDALGEKRYRGIVYHISFDAKTVNSVTTYTVDVLPSEKISTLRSGMTANVEFVEKESKPVLALPATAIHKGPAGFFVQMPNPNGPEPLERIVQLGVSNGLNMEIVGGLALG